jgi:hypothetical protein
MATCDIAKELDKIKKEELYLLERPDFASYVTNHLQINERSYRRIIGVSQTVYQLQSAGLAIPANQAQAEELSRLEVSLRPRVWNDLILRFESEEKLLTADDVKYAVDLIENHAPQAVVSDTVSDEIDLDLEQEEQDNGDAPLAPAKKPARKSSSELILTEKGEAALARIRKVCGTAIAEAIEDGTRVLSEREIKSWAEYDDQMMRTLTYYVMDQDWSLARAVSFNNKPIEGSTNIDDLVLLASGRGGSAQINYDNRAQITIKLQKP